MKHIIIAENSYIIRRGVDALIKKTTTEKDKEMVVVGEASTPTELYHLLMAKQADILILGLRLNICARLTPLRGLDGILLIRYLKKNFPHLRIISISAYQNLYLLRMVLNAGADGHMSYNDNEYCLENVLESMDDSRESHFCRTLPTLHYNRCQTNKLLTPCETNILQLLCQGLSAREIAEKTQVSTKTVSTQKKSAMVKLGVKTPSQLFFLLSKIQLFELSL
ncbi:response regulator transcription factor [Erwinia sp. HDF1-3R]|uniref:response regulator transcription factor n=1 Tax=Erwinia sp. HDF1-3R TaxID=3141543 RepID=UPI0031F58452